MRSEHREVETPRYDAETLREVTALAQQLQESERETLSAEQIEGIGEEVGLGREFVRRALRQLAVQHSDAALRREREREFRGLLAGWGLSGLWALLAWLFVPAVPAAAPFFTLVGVSLAPVVIGFLTGKGKAAAGASAVLALALAVVLNRVSGWAGVLAYLGVGTPLAAWLGWQGAKLRQHYFPPPGEPAGVQSSALLDVLVTVQRELEERAEHRAVLSIEVVGARDLRRSGGEAAVAGSFAQFREWVEGLVQRAGGECRAAGEGFLCTFPGDTPAVCVAREVQEGLGRFNAERNRLAAPFQVRCGIAAGAGADERAGALREQAEPGDILVTCELAAAALLELGALAPLRREAGAEPVFSWPGALRARRRP
jgi:hypothetical protein